MSTNFCTHPHSIECFSSQHKIKTTTFSSPNEARHWTFDCKFCGPRSPYSTFVSMFVMVLMQSNSRFEENFKKIPISLCSSSVIDSKSSLCYTYLNSFWSNKAKPHVRQISINKTSSSFLACVYAICMCVNMWRFSVDEMWLLKSR